MDSKRCPKCGHWMNAGECGTCFNMPDEQIRKYAEEISGLFKSWGSPTFLSYDILKRMKDELKRGK